MSTLAAAGLAPLSPVHAAPTTGSTFYVGGTTGVSCSDNNAGSATAPFCTFSKALDAAGPGDTIAVYSLPSTQEMDVTKSGTPGAPITIEGVPDKFGRIPSVFFNTHLAVVDGQHDIVIEGFEAHDNLASRTAGTAIVVSDGSSDVTLTRNHIEGGGGAAGIALSGGATGNVVAGNHIEGSLDGVTVTDSPGNAVTGNTLTSDSNVGIGLYGTSTGTTVANNISETTQTATTGRPAEISVDTAAESGAVIHHNILFPAPSSTDPDTGRPIPAGAAYSWGGVAYTDVASFAADSGQGAHDLVTDPRLNPANDEPVPGSPAIDSADSSAAGALPTDYRGNPRRDDPRVTDSGAGPATDFDRGAAEYQGGPVTAFSFSITGDATSETITVDAGATVAGFTPVASYTANFNGTQVTSSDPVFSHTFAVSSDPTQTKDQILDVTATGADGQVGSKAEQDYELGTVIQPTPALTVAADPATPGGIIADPTASAPAIDPTNGGSGSFINEYFIDWGDGSDQWVENAPVTSPVPHTYAKSGTYPVKLTVETGTLQSASVAHDITVTVPPPVTTPPVTTPPPTGTPTGPAGPAGPISPTAPSGTAGHASVTRLGGGTRYGTALDVSAAQWKNGAAGGVVIARGDAAPDALAGVPLAAHVHGPLLLTDPKALDGATAAEIKRVLGADRSKNVYLLGGTTAVSPLVQSQLTALGYHVHRIGGGDRFDTALRVARDGLGSTANVVVATGTDFADALAAGPLAASQNAAVVLSDGPVLDPATAAFVNAHSHVTAVGGAAVKAVAKAAPGKAATDLSGDDRYATAVKVAGAMSTSAGHAPVAAGLASGTVFPDALTGGAYAANAGIPLLLTDPKRLPPNVAALFATWKQQLAAIEIFGGQAAVSPAVQSAVATAVGGHIG